MYPMSSPQVRRARRRARELGPWDWLGLAGLALLAAGVAVLAIFALQVG